MTRLTLFILICICLAIPAFLLIAVSDADQPFIPLIEENMETDTSPEEISDVLVPVCKLIIDARAWAQGGDTSAAFSPNCRYLATFEAVSPRTFVNVNLFDLKTGRSIKRFAGNSSSIGKGTVVFSPDSRRLAFCTRDHIVVWDIVGDKMVCHIPVMMDTAVYSLRFSKDGKTLLGVIDKVYKVWNTEAKGAEINIKLFNAPDADFEIFHCYPDLSRALVLDRTTRKHLLRNLSNGRDTERFTNFCSLGPYSMHGAQENLSKMVFSDDDKLFALEHVVWENNKERRYEGNVLLVWDAVTGSDICTIPSAYPLTAYTFLPQSHTLITVSDPQPERPFVMGDKPHIPHITPMRKPVAKTKTRAIVEFWDISHLIWYEEKVNLFPRKIKTYYLEGEDNIHYMTASRDGKLLYMRSGKKIVEGDSELSIANGYIFSLDPNEKPELPAEIPLDDDVIVRLDLF